MPEKISYFINNKNQLLNINNPSHMNLYKFLYYNNQKTSSNKILNNDVI